MANSELQKTLQAGADSMAAVAPYANGIPIIGPAVTLGAGVAGGLLREPAPEAPPASLVTGPAGAPPPDAMAPPVPRLPSAPMPQGANIGALDAQGRRIAAAGAAGVQSAQEAGSALVDVGQDRKEAAQDIAEAQRQKAEAAAQTAEQQILAQTEYQQRLAQLKSEEDKAVGAAKKDYDESLQDARYAGIPREKRQELQSIINNPNATPVQQASAKAQLEKASQVDPDRYLGTAGRKVTAGIAMALGAMGSAYTGGPNYAFQMIQQAIQDDIETQKHNFAKRERESDKAGARVSATRQEFNASKDDALKQYGIGLEMAKLKLAKITAGIEGTEAIANGKVLEAQIDEEIIKNANAMEQDARGRYQQGLVAQGGLMSDAARMREQRAKDAREEGDPNALAANMAARGIELNPGVVLSKEEVKKVSEIKGAGDGLVAATNRLIEMREKAMSDPKLLVSPDFRKAAETAYYEAQAAWKEGKNMGAWDAGTQEVLEKVFGKPPSGIGFVQTRYEEIRDSARRDTATKLGAYGAKPAEARRQQGVPGEQLVSR